MFIKIAKIGKSSPASLAADELMKYLSAIDRTNHFALLSYDSYHPEYADTLWVGMDDSFVLPAVPNPQLDDAVSICVDGGKGYITGVNERSVLIAAYRYLRELGCAFLRPGKNGEILPEVDVTKKSVSVFEAASYRHRAVCIEGSVSYENVANLIEWLPKAGMNGFYNQFRLPYTFYDRWYSHMGNEKNFEPYHLTAEDAEGLLNQSVGEIKRRGLLYHAVGHGWTCEPFGIQALGWYNTEMNVSPEIQQHFALVNGKREFWKGVPMDTNLCYSSPAVRDTMASAIADYSAEHPEIDYMHVWLADGTNNHCECDACREKLPSDFYVQLLNEIDAKLAEKGLDTKIVFLIYVDLLWAPITGRLNNPDRFVLMFAPITRTYSSSMAACEPFTGELPPYRRNQNQMPSSVSENIAHLQNWQKQFSGDSFDFDYHYMWDHFKDIGNCAIARVLFDDMANLDQIGLNGMVSCQCVRSFFPHGLGMNAMAAALWNKNTDYDALAHSYFQNAFGSDGDRVYEYMQALSACAEPVFIRGEYAPEEWKALIPHMEEAQSIATGFRDFIARRLSDANPTVALSYFYLSLHADLIEKYLDWEICAARQDMEAAERALGELFAFADDHEKDWQPVYDSFIFKNTLKSAFNRLKSRLGE